MATYEITAPDGGKYRIQADTDEQAQAAINDILGVSDAPAGPEVGQGEAAQRGVKQGFLGNWGDEISALAAASPLGGQQKAKVGVGNFNPIDAVLGGARILGEKAGLWGGRSITGLVTGEDNSAQGIYERELARQRERDAAASEQNPLTYGGAQIGGAIANPLMRAAPQGMVPGAVTGAVQAGVAGAGAGTDAASRIGGAVTGAALGGAIGAVGGGIAQKFQQAAGSAAPSAANSVIEAGERMGVPVPRAIASDSKTVQAAGQAGRQSLFGGSKLEQAAEDFKVGVGDAAEKTAKSIGTGDVLTAGEAARSGINDTIENVLPGKARELYDAVDGLVNPNVATDLSVTRQKVADIAAKRQAAALDGPGAAAGEVLDAVTRPGGLTYEGIKTLRTNIGEMLKGGKLPANYSEGELKQIYRGLTADLRNSVTKAGGPEALKAFNRANQYRAAMQGRMEKLAKIVGSREDAAGEKVYSRLANMAGTGASADIKTLMMARRSMDPSQWDEITSAVINNLGRAKPGAEFSADRFMTQWAALSANGKAALFGGSGKLKAALDDIATLSGRMKTAEKYANRSNTGRVGVAALFGAGAMVDPVSALTAALGGEVTARILSQPATAASAAKWANKVAQANRVGAKGSAHATRATIQFLNEVGMPQAANDLGRAITGPLKSAADGEDKK